MTQNLRRGGLEKIIALLARELPAKGVSVDIICLHHPVSYQEIWEGVADVTVHTLFDDPKYFWTSIFTFSARLRKKIKSLSPDRVVIFGGQALIVSMFAGIRNATYGVQNSSAVHWLQNRPSYLLLDALERAAFRVMRPKIIACTESARRAYSERFSIPDHRCEVIANSTDVERFKTNAEKAEYLNKKIKILMVGTLYYQKNYEMALRGVSKLVENGVCVELKIVGEGPDRDELVGLATELEISEFVHFNGPSESVEEEYVTANLFWMTSRYEGFGIVLVEAMASGVPIVATDVDGIRDVISHERNGLLVQLNNADALYQQTMRIVDDQSLRDRLTFAGLDDVHNRFSPSSMAEKYYRALELNNA